MQLVSSLIPGNTIDVVVKKHAVQGGLASVRAGCTQDQEVVQNMDDV